MFHYMLLVYLLLLTGLMVGAVLVHTKFSSLALPVPIGLRILLILLPILSGLNTFFTRPSLSGSRRVALPSSSRQPTVSLNTRMTIYTVLNGIQAVATTVLATLFGTFMAPTSDPIADCRLNTQWEHFWRTHDRVTIGNIQDRLNCCGFRTIRDRPYPFPFGKDPNPLECSERFHRKTACLEPWSQGFRANAGAAVTIIVAVGVLQVINVVYGPRMLRAMGWFWPRQHRDASREPLLTPVEEYDEEEIQRDDRRHINYGRNGNGPRLEPSALGSSERNEWTAE